MTPMRSLMKYNLDMLEVVDDEKRLLNWLRMEKWIADRPDHPGEAAKQWLKDLYQQNKLVKNELELDGKRVDLGQITMPVLNVYAKDDHIIPPATSRALGPKVGSIDYKELACPAAMSACSWAASRRSCSRRRMAKVPARQHDAVGMKNKIVSPAEAVAVIRRRRHRLGLRVRRHRHA